MLPSCEDPPSGAQPVRLELRLLGLPRLLVDQREVLLERKPAALLAYLCLEGENRRGKLAGLLWPDVGEQVARNNLSQTLRRLRQAARGISPVVAGETLRLLEDLPVDVKQLLEWARGKQYEELGRLAAGGLLDGLEFDECEDLLQWLEERRGELARLKVVALESRLEGLEAEGELRAAVSVVRQILALEPYRESAYLRLMQLYYLLGDRSAALSTYQRCKTLLNTELGIDPPQPLNELADVIRRSGMPCAQGKGSASATRRLPLSLLRPPVLIGRRLDWQRMERAWERDQGILLAGPAGCGKTRLMQEFLGDRGRYFWFEGRAEEAGIGYAAHGRCYRQMLAAFPHLELPRWARRELARIIPELDDAGDFQRNHQPPDDEARLRLYQAMAEATDLAVQAGMHHVAVDDLHLFDAASVEAGQFVCARQWSRLDGMRSVVGLREAELGTKAREAMNALLDAGLAELIRLAPLSEAETGDLIESLALKPAIARHAAELHDLCGGLPSYLLETLRELYRDGLSAEQWIAEGRVPHRVRHLLQRQLQRLSPEAREQASRLASGHACASGQVGELTRAEVLRESRISSGYLRLLLSAEGAAN